MSKDLQIIQTCDHVIKDASYVAAVATVTKTANAYDVIDSGAIIAKIVNVYDATTSYAIGVDYNQYSHNSLEWLNPTTEPALDATYTVEYMYLSESSAVYGAEECPRCSGRGWFADIMNSLSTKMKVATSTYKLAQDVVVTLLTEDTDGFGTKLPELIGTTTATDADKLNIVTSAVISAETQVKQRQAELIRDGVTLPDDEKLYKITLINISVEDPTEIYVELSIRSVSGQNAELALAI